MGAIPLFAGIAVLVSLRIASVVDTCLSSWAEASLLIDSVSDVVIELGFDPSS
jgi:hypothetical protein